jgi:hypothetical protein
VNKLVDGYVADHVGHVDKRQRRLMRESCPFRRVQPYMSCSLRISSMKKTAVLMFRRRQDIPNYFRLPLEVPASRVYLQRFEQILIVLNP